MSRPAPAHRPSHRSAHGPPTPTLPLRTCVLPPASVTALLSSLSGRNYTVLLSIIFGGLAIVALISIVFMLLHRRRKSNM